jgi:hypothetical protein
MIHDTQEENINPTDEPETKLIHATINSSLKAGAAIMYR